MKCDQQYVSSVQVMTWSLSEATMIKLHYTLWPERFKPLMSLLVQVMVSNHLNQWWLTVNLSVRKKCHCNSTQAVLSHETGFQDIVYLGPVSISEKTSRCREIGSLNYRIALKFDRHVGSTAAEVPVKFQSDRTILHTNLAASRLCEILQLDVLSDIETSPRCWSFCSDDNVSKDLMMGVNIEEINNQQLWLSIIK